MPEAIATIIVKVAYPTITYPTATGVTANYGYDNDGNLNSLSASSTVTTGTAISDSWQFDSDERLVVSSINGVTGSWANYNANKQITAAPNLATSTNNDTYTLALNGDITKDAPYSGTATNFAYYSSGNELCNTATSSTTCGSTPANGAKYVFTTNGQRSSATPYVSSVAGTTTNYNWNAYGQLCSTGPSSGPSSTPCGTLPTGGTQYQYNGNGQRVTASTASSTIDSTWDAATGDIPLNINDSTTTSSGTTNTSYIYGDLLFGGTAPIEQITTTSSGTSVSYLVSNQSGVQGVYNGSGTSLGAVQEMAVYSLYGNQTLSSGTKVTPFGFQGSYTDSTGLIYLVNRYYDSVTDEFMSIDPEIAITNQPYVFTNDNPLNLEDPVGLGNKCQGPNNPTEAQLVKYHCENWTATSKNPKWPDIGTSQWSNLFGTFGAILGMGDPLAVGGDIGESSNAMSSMERVGSGLKDDLFHRVTSWVVDDPAAFGSKLTGNDGVQRMLFKLPGEVNGKPGTFEWIVEMQQKSSVITHQLFKRG